MKNELLTIGPFTVYGYGLMIAVGVLMGWAVAEVRARKLKLAYEHIFYLVMWCAVGGFICAKILYWITDWKEIMKNPSSMLGTDGFVVYGGIIGGILAGYIYCRIRKLNFLKYFDLMMPSIALGQGFGRIGCFLAGCCYGRETLCPLSVTFTHSDFAPNGIPLIPTQIYSSLLDFLLFLVLLYIAKHKKADGQVAAAYLVFYSVGRFILEFFRGDMIRGNVGVLSTSQFISIFTGIAGIILFVITKKWNKNKQYA